MGDMREDFELLERVIKVLKSKGEDYGNNNEISPYAVQLATAKILTKAERIANIVFNNHDPNHESLDDSILDLCGYCVLMDRAIKRSRKDEE